MQLVLYDDQKNVLQIEHITDPIIGGKNITWKGGGMSGVQTNFILIDEGEAIGDVVTVENIANDQSGFFLKVDLHEENKQLKERLTYAENAILSLMNYV